MADTKLSKIAGGGGGISKLAPDLDFVSSSTLGMKQSIGIDATGSLTEILSLTGKFELGLLSFSGLTNGDMNKIKLTIDGVDIWNEDPLTPPSGTTFVVLGGGATGYPKDSYLVEESLSLSVQMASDPSISLLYSARPII